MSVHSITSRSTRALFLAVAVLLAGTLGGPPTASAHTPTVDADSLLSSLRQTVSVASSDSALVDAAAALLEARAKTEISFSTYKEGVRVFQKLRPDFYGNFFGDPFYATYDVDYFRMDRLRRRVGREVARPSGLSGLFSCNPFTYDPAFQGACRGFHFAAADFLFLPTGPHSSGSDRSPFIVSASFFCSPADDANSAPTDLDLPESARADAERLASNAAKEAEPAKLREVDPVTEIEPVSTVDEVEVPEDASSRMQERASILRQKALSARMRYEIKRRYGDVDDLSPRVRAQLASRLAETGYFHDERAEESPRTLDHTGQIDRLERQLDRLGNREDGGSRAERAASPQDRPIPNSEPNENGPVLKETGGSQPPDAGSPARDTPDRPTPSRNQDSSNSPDGASNERN